MASGGSEFAFPPALDASHLPHIIAMMRKATGAGEGIAHTTKFFEAIELTPGWIDLLLVSASPQLAPRASTWHLAVPDQRSGPCGCAV
jgi:hypothetical protein